MVITLRVFLPLLTALGLLAAPALLRAQDEEASSLADGFEEKVSTIASHAVSGLAGSAGHLPGVSLAEGISEVTGVAISPLLGVSAVGAWKYWQTAEASRASLPWFCQPWAWGSGLAMIALCFLKDVLGSLVPGILKKPLDWLELFENKASALVASTAFVPLIALAMAEYQKIGPESTAMTFPSGPGLAAWPLADLLGAALQSPWVTVPLTLTLFAVIWLASHALHVLIALSPFALLDAVLKLVKLAVLVLLTTCATMIHSVSPVPALLVCAVIALFSALVARWSFRLLVFGAVMVGDLLLRRRLKPEDVRSEGVRAFLARPCHGLRARSRGRLTVEAAAGRWFFTRRPWLFLPEQKTELPAAGWVLVKGLLYPSLCRRDTPEAKPRRICFLLPRYRGLEPCLAAHWGGLEVLESPLARGFQAVRQWLSELLSGADERSAAV